MQKTCLPCLSKLSLNARAAPLGEAYQSWDRAQDSSGALRADDYDAECLICTQPLRGDAEDKEELGGAVEVLSEKVGDNAHCSLDVRKAAKLGCRHAYHKVCLYKWLAAAEKNNSRKKRRCPECNACVALEIVQAAVRWDADNSLDLPPLVGGHTDDGDVDVESDDDVDSAYDDSGPQRGAVRPRRVPLYSEWLVNRANRANPDDDDDDSDEDEEAAFTDSDYDPDNADDDEDAAAV
jgi:hypothetical protein